MAALVSRLVPFRSCRAGGTDASSEVDHAQGEGSSKVTLCTKAFGSPDRSKLLAGPQQRRQLLAAGSGCWAGLAPARGPGRRRAGSPAIPVGNQHAGPGCATPDFPRIHQELRSHRHLTLALLWQEYKETHPGGYQYSRFCELYRAWAKKLDVVLRQEHRAGDKLYVDHAGPTVAGYFGK